MPFYPNESRAIENLQRYLRTLSYHDKRITPPPIDGIWERDTRQALQDFQALYGLPVTGRADERTWNALYREYRAALARNTPPRPIAFFTSSNPPIYLRTGAERFEVSVLQHMLRELSERYDLGNRVTPTGKYDAVTADAVKAFQARNHLPDSGEVDLATWNALSDQFNALSPDL